MQEHHVILGGCGFIGRHVALMLARTGHRVTVADRAMLVPDFPRDVQAQITFERFEMGSANWDGLVADADVVHHYAWSSIPASANANPGGDLVTNVGATLALLDALQRRGQGRVVFASSGGTVYGVLDTVPVPESHPLRPVTAYGTGKASAELYLGLYRALHGIDCRIARIANPFGAGQDLARGLGAVTTFLHRALNHQAITIWGTGEIVRDYIHISDVVRGLVQLAAAPPGPDYVFNIGSGEGLSLNRIISSLETDLGRSLDVVRTDARDFDLPVSILDIRRAKEVLRWQPASSFVQGLAMTLRDLSEGAQFSRL